MANNTAFSGLFDAKTGCRDFSTTALTQAGGASGVHAHDTGTYSAFIDLAGAGAPTGAGGTQIGLVLASIDLKVANWVEGSSGTLSVQVAYSSDGALVDETCVVQSYAGASPTDWVERIPFTNEYRNVKYRYVQIQVAFTGTGAEAELGWHVTADARLT